RHTGGRYWLLETIREYALEELEDKEEADDARDLHARWFLDLAERIEPELTGAEQSDWLGRVSGEHDNLRAAPDPLLAVDDSESALRLAASLVVFWFIGGHYEEGRDWLDRSLAGVDSKDSPALAKALWGSGFLGALVGDAEPAAAALDRGLDVSRRI